MLFPQANLYSNILLSSLEECHIAILHWCTHHRNDNSIHLTMKWILLLPLLVLLTWCHNILTCMECLLHIHHRCHLITCKILVWWNSYLISIIMSIYKHKRSTNSNSSNSPDIFPNMEFLLLFDSTGCIQAYHSSNYHFKEYNNYKK